MMRLLTMWTAVFLVAAAAYPAIGSRRANEDCTNDIHLGMNSTGGNRSTLEASAGVVACTDNEKRRWALEAETLIIKTSDTERSHDVAGSYDYRFGKGWLAMVNASEEADSASGLQSRFIVAPGIGLERFPQWGTFRLGAGFGRTWEDVRDAPRVSFPEAWSQMRVFWKVRKDITLKENLEFYAETKDESNYWYASKTEAKFKFGEHFALQTGFGFKWDHKPTPGFGRTDWSTSTLFAFSWGGGEGR